MPLTLAQAWSYAKEYFSNPKNEKLPRSDSKRGKALNIIPGIMHSFIKITRVPSPEESAESSEAAPFIIYRKIRSNKTVIKGGNGRIYTLIDENNNRSLVKKITGHASTVEALTLQHLGYSTGQLKRTDGSLDSYIQMNDCGTELGKYILQNPWLSPDNRLRFAIDLCYQLFQLHLLGYAHLDVKHNNNTIDNNGRVRLIDFGSAEKNPYGLLHRSMGAPIFRPPNTHRLRKVDYDYFAVLRQLFPSDSCLIPGQIYHFEQRERDAAILSESMRQDPDLVSIASTSIQQFPTRESYLNHRGSILGLCAGLIAKKYQLEIQPELLQFDVFTGLLLSSMHFKGYSSIEMRRIISQPLQYLRNNLHQKFFYANLPLARVLFMVSQLDKRIELKKIFYSRSWEKAVLNLEKAGLLRHLRSFLHNNRLLNLVKKSDYSPSLINAIACILDETPEFPPNHREARLNFVINNPQCSEHINHELEQALWLRVKYNVLSERELFLYPQFALLINRLSAFGMMKYFLRIRHRPLLVELINKDDVPDSFMKTVHQLYSKWGDEIYDNIYP